jgi:hypothetical protein
MNKKDVTSGSVAALRQTPLSQLPAPPSNPPPENPRNSFRIEKNPLELASPLSPRNMPAPIRAASIRLSSAPPIPPPPPPPPPPSHQSQTAHNGNKIMSGWSKKPTTNEDFGFNDVYRGTKK